MVFEPFPETSDYFPREKQAMINLRVRDLDGLLERLRAAGIEVANEQRDTQAGSFARIHDPEQNPIEFWQPPAVYGESQ